MATHEKTASPALVRQKAGSDGPHQTEPGYLCGFGNEHSSEAIAGALPHGKNSPQRHLMGLYAEQVNASAFTVPRADNQRSWLYRLYPSAASQSSWTRWVHERLDEDLIGQAPSPNRYRWLPWPVAGREVDFLDGLTRIAQSGSAREASGMSLYAYAVSRSMHDRVFSNIDGEMLIIPQRGQLRLRTEFGILHVEPGEIAIIPRSIKFSVELLDADCRGFVCENLGLAFKLPERGLIGANGLANAADFQAPVASFEDSSTPVECIAKFGGRTWTSQLKRSPFDVVAWRGTLAPYKYNLYRFNAVNSVIYDHADPSIFTALTSPSGLPGIANADFCVFPPRWLVAEETFRPPYFHRNVMSEFVLSLRGAPESRGENYKVGSFHLHNAMAPHGPDPDVFEAASSLPLAPKREDTLMVMFESRLPFSVSNQALQAPNFDPDYERNWDRMKVIFDKNQPGMYP